MRPPQSLNHEERRPGSVKRAAWMLETLRLAVARAFPRAPEAQREDLVQTALLRVLERERGDEQNPVRTASYLWRVAFNVTASELRKRRSEASLMHEVAVVDVGTQEESASEPGLGLAIRDCLSSLAEPRRMAVQLHLEGFRAEEASRVLHWNVKRVQNLMYRGLANLRQCLERKGLER